MPKRLAYPESSAWVCMHFVPLPLPMPSIIRRISPKSRNGSDTPISQPPDCMTDASTGQRIRRHLRWSINEEWVTDLSDSMYPMDFQRVFLSQGDAIHFS